MHTYAFAIAAAAARCEELLRAREKAFEGKSRESVRLNCRKYSEICISDIYYVCEKACGKEPCVCVY